MLLPIAAVLFTANLVMPIADGFPTFPVGADCHNVSGLGPSTSRKKMDCVRAEQAAHDKLQSEWTHFTPTSRAQCVRTATLAPKSSYLELLTCLEMTRDPTSIPEELLDLLKGKPDHQ